MDPYPAHMLMAQIASDDVLSAAFEWLCHRRKDYPPSADVWSFRRDWETERVQVQASLRAATYRFDLLDRVTLRDGACIDLWCARDALVLKAMNLCLAQWLPASRTCTHLRGHGGAKKAIRQVATNLPRHSFVFRTDVKSYYTSIDHYLLLERLAERISDRAVMNLLSQYMRRTVCDGGKAAFLGRRGLQPCM